MDNNMSSSLQYVSMADAERESNSNKAGDFANSGEIEKHMPMLMQMMGQLGSMGVVPAQPAMPGEQSAMAGTQQGMPAQAQAANPSGNMQAPGAPPVPAAPAMPAQANGSMPGNDAAGSYSGAAQKSSMPDKKVLTEPCTVSQPMNESLRNQHSMGSFYFLK